MVINRAYLETISRRELQDIAKQFSVRANQKSSVIVDLVLFEVHKEKQKNKQQEQQDENDKIAANKLSEPEEKELSSRLKKLSVVSHSTLNGALKPNQESSVHETVKNLTESSENPHSSKAILSHTPIKYNTKQKFEAEQISRAEESEVKISYAVNAIKALNCKNGVSYEQIQSFIANNPTIHLDSEDLNDVLCTGVDKGRILAVSGIGGGVRFFTPRLHAETYTTNTSKISAFINSTKSTSTETKPTPKPNSQRFKVQTNQDYLSSVGSSAGSKSYLNLSKSALHRAMALERRNRQTARKTFIDTWSSQIQKCNGKISSIQMLNECICAQCGCSKSFFSKERSKQTNLKTKVAFEKFSNGEIKKTSSSSSNSTSSRSLIPLKGGSKITPTTSSKRVSLQLLYNSSEKPLQQQGMANKHKIPATPLVKKNNPSGLKHDIIPSPPWQIMESKSKPGKFYYHNPETKESKWSYTK